MTNKNIKAKNFSFLIVIILLFSLGILLGAFIGFYWHQTIANSINNLIGKGPDDISFCPPEDLVRKNQSNPETFMVKDLKWKVDYHGWEAIDKIGFMQALINKENNLVCYYQWPNPKEQSTNLWMTVKLSPKVTQKINAYGSYWEDIKDNRLLCSAGINACAFKVN